MRINPEEHDLVRMRALIFTSPLLVCPVILYSLFSEELPEMSHVNGLRVSDSGSAGSAVQSLKPESVLDRTMALWSG